MLTDSELNLIEAHFKNPPSASTNAELALKLVAEIRRLKVYLAVPPAIVPDELPGHVVTVGARPTPPPPAVTPAAAPHAKKAKAK